MTRDKESFTQIRNGTNRGKDGKSNSSKSSNSPRLNAPAEIEEKIQSRRTSVENSIRSETQDLSVARTPESEETQSNCTSNIPYTIELDESFQFLKSLNLPLDLTGAQQFLQDKYIQVIEAMHKQTRELNVIQKQIKIQGEIRDLMDRLEKERVSNDINNERNTTREMLKKFKEMQRACLGWQAEKPTVESVAICSKRLQEIDVQSRLSAVTSAENQPITSEVDEAGYSPMEVEPPKPTQPQPCIFFNQERWLQAEAHQAQLERQALLVQPMLNSQHFREEQLMVNQQQQMLAQQLEQRQLDEEIQQISQQQSQELFSQYINPSHAEPPQEILTTANESSFTNDLQQNFPSNFTSVSRYSADDSLYEYQWL